MRVRTRLSVVVVVLVVLAVPPTVRGALLGPQTDTISTSGPGVFPDVAITPSGWTLAVWSRTTDLPGIWISWRPPGGTFEKEHRIGSGTLGGVVAAADDKVAIGWEDSTASRLMLLAPGRHAGAQTRIGEGKGLPPRLAADDHGTVVAVTRTSTEQLDGMTVMTRRRGGSFVDTERLTGEHNCCGGPAIAMNSAGEVVVAQSPANPPTTWIRPAGAKHFGPAEALPNHEYFGVPEMGVTDRGDVIASWGHIVNLTSSSDGVILIRPREATSWAQARHVEVHGVTAGGLPGNTFDSGVTPTTDNRLVLIDSEPTGTFTRDLPDGGDVSALVPFAPGPLRAFGVAHNAGGDLFAAASTGRNDSMFGAIVGISERRARGEFPTIVPISPIDSDFAGIAANDSGAVAVVWVHSVRAHGIVEQLVQGAVQDGKAELAPTTTNLSVADGRATIPLACTGLDDCTGHVELAGRTRGVRLRPGSKVKLHLRVSGKRGRLQIKLRGVSGKAASRTYDVRFKRR